MSVEASGGIGNLSFDSGTSDNVLNLNTAILSSPSSAHQRLRGQVSTSGLSNKPQLRSQVSSGLSAPIERRRSSQRSIKRKKFDDELVESSLVKTDRARIRTESKSDTASQPDVPPQPPPPPPEKKKPTKSSKKSSKRQKNPTTSNVGKDLGRWKPQDDLALITAVQQTCHLSTVHLGVKFSCKFSLREIQDRWYGLLYDPVISKLALSAMYQLHPDVVAAIQAKTLYSNTEEGHLGTVPSTAQPSLETFQELLDKHPVDFHPARVAKALYNHWLLMKQAHILPDQSVQPMPKGDHVLNFSDAEDMMNDAELRDPKDDVLEHELSVSDRRQKREVRHLEEDLHKWQVMVDNVTGVSPQDFDGQTLAVLRGRLVRYLMRSKEITIGRATKENQVDVDLSLEGPAWKISRRQGIIKLKTSGEFYIGNEGKRAIYIDGKPLLQGIKQKLNDNTVVEMAGLRFIFLVNKDLINVIKAETAKLPG